ncbi:hypothetical protein, partial [Pseudomonas syringae group genomosp. 3]|uniref:hypothetical protein n=1 Tax=Pseudomonas syringae group genomosp. 3 TaxID=251701 RepID=UPI001E5D9312
MLQFHATAIRQPGHAAVVWLFDRLPLVGQGENCRSLSIRLVSILRERFSRVFFFKETLKN